MDEQALMYERERNGSVVLCLTYFLFQMCPEMPLLSSYRSAEQATEEATMRD